MLQAGPWPSMCCQYGVMAGTFRSMQLELIYLLKCHHRSLYDNMYGSTASATGDGDYKRLAPRVLRLANQLRELGVESVLQLPTIVIAGDQSSGKSSVVEAIAGVALPRAEGTCTRCPTEVRMRWVRAACWCVLCDWWVTCFPALAAYEARTAEVSMVCFRQHAKPAPPKCSEQPNAFAPGARVRAAAPFSSPCSFRKRMEDG